ncbi:MAG: hypothetical protein QNJ40_12535, partial [Xanthomonadales bacterium]|nr:hypothetical protein [Xanthomonadales bacterium]
MNTKKIQIAAIVTASLGITTMAVVGKEDSAAEATQSYIISGQNISTIERHLAEKDIPVLAQLDIINAVSAELTPSQIDQLDRVDGLRLFRDRKLTVETAGDPLSCEEWLVMDQFETDHSYSANDGNTSWLNNWNESDENNGPSSGHAWVDNGKLYLKADSYVDSGALRKVQLYPDHYGFLSFDLTANDAIPHGAQLEIEIIIGDQWWNDHKLEEYKLTPGEQRTLTYNLAQFAGEQV